MKLRLGNVLIETDHIEQAEIQVSEYYEWVAIKFVSGEKLQIACKGNTNSTATWNTSAESLIQAIEGSDRYLLKESK